MWTRPIRGISSTDSSIQHSTTDMSSLKPATRGKLIEEHKRCVSGIFKAQSIAICCLRSGHGCWESLVRVFIRSQASSSNPPTTVPHNIATIPIHTTGIYRKLLEEYNRKISEPFDLPFRTIHRRDFGWCVAIR